MDKLNRKFCVAPMMGYTTPHARRLYRILSKHAFLFTEMIPTKTMIFSKKRDLIIENAENIVVWTRPKERINVDMLIDKKPFYQANLIKFNKDNRQ